jgi:FlaA1/EpsC-like NDP-sugar epimerase
VEVPNTIRNRYLLVSDFFLLAAGPFIAGALRFEGLTWDPAYVTTVATYAALALSLKLAICLAFGLYSRLWSHASLPDMEKILQACGVIAGTCLLLGLVALPGAGLTPLRVPISVVVLDAFLALVATASPRMLMRVLATWQQRRGTNGGRRALIAGAGAAGQMILRELLTNPQLGLTPVGFVDDDPAKRHHRLGDLPILGSLAEIPEIVEHQRIGEIIIAMPTAPGSVLRQVVRAADGARIPTRTVPALFEILSGRVSMSHLRKVEIHDLLRRDPVRTDLEPVRALVAGRTVLVTGAGGSIGSELARQVARLAPSRLVLLGNAENEIFDILNELREGHPTLALTPIIADVRDKTRISAVFGQVRPHTVFHAAAHKHVPLMEENPADAVTNNVLGTKTVVDCAVEWDTAGLVLISTDKAVRPTSIMGATKRVAEMVVQSAAVRYRRNFVSVRFGNVLGSRGSVVPTFLRQIQAGGPVTVTHPDMNRFFMTIPEAVQLVLHAAVLGRGAEVFVLDMGEPVRIADLAADMIRLSGLEVGKDIEIRYTGVRPGERLYEERFFHTEDVEPTAHPKIERANNNHLREDFGEMLESLIAAARECCPDEELRRWLKTLVPEFAGVPTDDGRPPVRADVPTPARRPASAWRTRPWAPVIERRSCDDRRLSPRRSGLPQPPLVERRAKGERRAGSDRRVATPATVMATAAIERSGSESEGSVV